ncbi:MAG: selenocysteine-specific translation elongation factor [Solirubrobacteraceae bacterium MAG38_C4-C5]|nr:selenocysteine-specific translation elongation factor [Candidatus Siliceabacter maunaloa]
MSGREAPPAAPRGAPAPGEQPAAPPLTLGTAGHIDHGKSALIGALTGVDTDRLAEERRRGISIELGYARLDLPSGRALSVVDVPGHERFVRTMVAGATGIDLFLMCVATDDGVMPQTWEHAAVLAGLGVRDGVVAITKADLRDGADVASASEQAAELLPGAEIVAVSARAGTGLDALRGALDRCAARLTGRAALLDGGAPVLHVDRSFTIKGAGTVVTGTLWRGSVGRGDEVELLPASARDSGARVRARVRGVQVHDAPVQRAAAGQRVAVNLVGVARDAVGRGDVVAGAGAGLAPSHVLDVHLDEGPDGPGGRGGRGGLPARVQVHHGTRESAARLAPLGGRLYQLRLERPLVAARGDRLVLRSIAPPDTLGGGVVLDPRARRHGPSRAATARLTALSRGEDPDVGAEQEGAARGRTGPQPAAPLSAPARALEERLRAAGHEPPSRAELDDDAQHLDELRAAGRTVRIGRDLHAHPDALTAIERRVRELIAAEGCVTLARLRDELQTTRKFAQAHLEHLDAVRVTLRRPDDTRVLRRRVSEQGVAGSS